MAHCRLFGVAGDEQHLQAGASRGGDFCQLAAVHAGQADVRHQQINVGGGVDDLQGRLCITHLDVVVAQVLQHRNDDRPHTLLVFDHQHGFAGSEVGHLRRLRRRFWACAVALVTRQKQRHAGALVGLAVNSDMAARLLHEPVDHRQPQPRSLADRFGGEEGLEGPRDDTRWHARAIVGDADRHIVARGQFGLCGRVGGVNFDVLDRDIQPPAIGHRITGVDDEVQQGTFELAGVDLGRPQLGAEFDRQRHIGAERAREHVLQRFDQLDHVDAPDVERLAPREREQALRQRAGPLGAGRRPFKQGVEAVQLAGLETPNPKPQTPNPKPQTPNPKPQCVSTQINWHMFVAAACRRVGLRVSLLACLFLLAVVSLQARSEHSKQDFPTFVVLEIVLRMRAEELSCSGSVREIRYASVLSQFILGWRCRRSAKT